MTYSSLLFLSVGRTRGTLLSTLIKRSMTLATEAKEPATFHITKKLEVARQSDFTTSLHRDLECAHKEPSGG